MSPSGALLENTVASIASARHTASPEDVLVLSGLSVSFQFDPNLSPEEAFRNYCEDGLSFHPAIFQEHIVHHRGPVKDQTDLKLGFMRLVRAVSREQLTALLAPTFRMPDIVEFFTAFPDLPTPDEKCAGIPLLHSKYSRRSKTLYPRVVGFKDKTPSDLYLDLATAQDCLVPGSLIPVICLPPPHHLDFE